VKTLDLSAVTAPVLDELILLDCGKLCAILWPPEDKKKRYLGKLRVDTTQKEGTAGGDHGTGRSPPPTAFNWYISVRDARVACACQRLFRSPLCTSGYLNNSIPYLCSCWYCHCWQQRRWNQGWQQFGMCHQFPEWCRTRTQRQRHGDV
jgi:hypothetical protein